MIRLGEYILIGLLDEAEKFLSSWYYERTEKGKDIDRLFDVIQSIRGAKIFLYRNKLTWKPKL